MNHLLPLSPYHTVDSKRITVSAREKTFELDTQEKNTQVLYLAPEAAYLHAQLKNQREQIARDLHDGIGSQLTHIISRLEILAFNHKGIEGQLSDLRDFTSETFQQLRETIWVLNQPEIAYGQLTERVRGLLTRISSEHETLKIKITAYGDSQVLLSPHMASSIFRIVQESVNNAMKYADASIITVCLAVDSCSLTVLVSDDGKGFCQEEITLGYGLQNIEKRAEELRGTFSVQSSSSGTNIHAEFPIEG